MIDVAYLRAFRRAESVRLPITVGGRDIPRFGPGVLTTESQEIDAWEVEWEGEMWRCPRMPRRRRLEALVAYHRATERFGAGMVSNTVAASARRELGRIAVGTSAPAPVLVSPWAPPLRWFIAFDPEDRVGSMLFRTASPTAVTRLERVAGLIRGAGLPEALAAEHDDLASWIAGADGEMLELDYRETAGRLGEVGAVMDESVTEMQNSITALAAGDLQLATSWFATAMSRWAYAHAIGMSN